MNHKYAGVPRLVQRDGLFFHVWPSGAERRAIVGGSDDVDPPTGGYVPPASQEEFDRIINARLQRQRQALPSDEEIADLRKAKEDFDALVAKDQTELQRTQTALQQAEQARQAAEQAAQAAQLQATQAAIHSAIVRSAAGKAVDPDVVAQLILADESNAVTVDNAGQVTGADTAVTTLLAAKPYLAGRPQSFDLGQGQQRGGGDNSKPTGLAAGRARHEQRNK